MNLSRSLIARTELIDVNSDQRECAVVYSPIRAAKNALHESHIGVYEGQLLGLSGLDVGLGHHPADVGQTNKGVEIVDDYWLRSIGSIALGANTWNEPPKAGEPRGSAPV